MREVSTGIRRLLAQPFVYELWSRVVGGGRAHDIFVREHVRPGDAARVLDLGCGPAELAHRLPTGVSYHGVDISREYVERARLRLGDGADLRVSDASAFVDVEGPPFDLVIAYGLLHHLDDEQVAGLFRNASNMLAPGGRVVTADPVFTPEQSSARRALMSRDRGQHIRTRDEYSALAATAFSSVRCVIYHNLLRIPYSHCVLECGGADAVSAKA